MRLEFVSWRLVRFGKFLGITLDQPPGFERLSSCPSRLRVPESRPHHGVAVLCAAH